MVIGLRRGGNAELWVDGKLDVSSVSPMIEIRHFDHDFFGMDSLNFDDDLLMLVKQYPDFFKMGFEKSLYKNRFYDNEIRELYDAVDSVFSSTKTILLKSAALLITVLNFSKSATGTIFSL